MCYYGLIQHFSTIYFYLINKINYINNSFEIIIIAYLKTCNIIITTLLFQCCPLCTGPRAYEVTLEVHMTGAGTVAVANKKIIDEVNISK
jgi:hypothetical protein